MSNRVSFQDPMIGFNHCWGCGPDNKDGLKIKSYWEKEGSESICSWRPRPSDMAGPKHILNGGIIGTLFDCHSICTAIAGAYFKEGKPIGPPFIWYVTGSLKVSYLKPTPIDAPVVLRAIIKEETSKKTIVSSTLFSAEIERAHSEVLAIRVSSSWYQAPNSH